MIPVEADMPVIICWKETIPVSCMAKVISVKRCKSIHRDFTVMQTCSFNAACLCYESSLGKNEEKKG